MVKNTEQKLKKDSFSIKTFKCSGNNFNQHQTESWGKQTNKQTQNPPV